MTMTLDEVRKTRFHMSRRNGYEVTDVDIFVDKVEETIQTLTTENENLRRQVNDSEPRPTTDKEVEALQGQLTRLTEDRNKAQAQVKQLRGELDQARARAQLPAGAPAAADPALAQEIQQLRGQLLEAQKQVNDARTQAAQAKAQLAEAQKGSIGQDQLMRLTAENHQLREQVEKLSAAEKAGDGTAIAVTTSPEASSAVVRLVQLATEQADNLVAEATAEANRRKASIDDEIRGIREQAEGYAAKVRTEADSHAAQVKSEAQFSAEEMLRTATDSSAQITAEAQQRAERVDRDARTNAERLVQEAQQRAATIDTEIASRRSEVFGALENERDLLFAKVEKLRTYEKSFRQTMKGYLRSQIERLDSSQFAPEEVPELMQTPGRTANEWSSDQTSSTPRLDALLEG